MLTLRNDWWSWFRLAGTLATSCVVLGKEGKSGLLLCLAGLAASVDAVGVTLGGIVGHAICTGAAVLGGRQMATHIDERTISVGPLAET